MWKVTTKKRFFEAADSFVRERVCVCCRRVQVQVRVRSQGCADVRASLSVHRGQAPPRERERFAQVAAQQICFLSPPPPPPLSADYPGCLFPTAAAKYTVDTEQPGSDAQLCKVARMSKRERTHRQIQLTLSVGTC